MASVNKVILDPGQLRHLYLDQLMSLPMVASALGASTSTVRARLKEMGILRTRRKFNGRWLALAGSGAIS